MEGLQSRNGLYGFEFVEHDKRRVDPDEKKGYEIKQFWQRSHEIVNLSAKGYKNVEIAEILNITPDTVSNTLNSVLGQHKLSDLRKERDAETKVTLEKVRVLTSKAFALYHQIFDDNSGECSLKDKKNVADTVILELSGLRTPTRIQSHSIHSTLSIEELEEFKKRGIAAAREAGMIVEVDCSKIAEVDCPKIGQIPEVSQDGIS